MTTPRGRHARNDDTVVSVTGVRLNTESFRVPTGAEFIAITHGAPTTSSWPPATDSPRAGVEPESVDTDVSLQPAVTPSEVFRRRVLSHRAAAHPAAVPASPATAPAARGAAPRVAESRMPSSRRTAPVPAPSPAGRSSHGHRRRGDAVGSFVSLWRLPSGTEPHLLRPTAQRQLTYWLFTTLACCVGLGIGLALLIHGLVDGMPYGTYLGCLLSTSALCLFFCANAFLRPGDVVR
ncbi:hypothetical protein OS125_09760 [Corynebacterium sp. P7003]|uniref:Uncharacterized protein n=1 Tax=Corynebacterium pygosceleis TaxID=2800406 RepID=A0ABT3WUT3_9CORY|nr:hypothetical protein [Corynebacterium pygosceleis]MCX7445523.1 hypothetical protein [Corynebacterium pygosceleis]